MDVISACADRRDTIVVKDIQKRFQPVHICIYYYVTRVYFSDYTQCKTETYISYNIFDCTYTICDQYSTNNNNYCNTCIKCGNSKKNLITDLEVGPYRSSGPSKSVVPVMHSFHPKCTIVLQHWYSRSRCFVLTRVSIIYYITAGERRRPSSTVGIRFQGPQYCRLVGIIIYCR